MQQLTLYGEPEVVEEEPGTTGEAMTEQEIEDAALVAFNLAMSEVFKVRFRFYRKKLDLAPDMTREAFLTFGYFLKVVSDGIQFWAGDWYVYGESRWGDDIVQVLGIRHKTLANWGWTCRKVAPEDRRSDISFGHHPEVASLEPAAQREVLAEAATENYSVRQTRERVESIKQEQAEKEAESRGLKVEKVAPPKPCSRCHGSGHEPSF